MAPAKRPKKSSAVPPGNPPEPRVEFRGQARPEPAERRLSYEREFAYLFGRPQRDDVELVLVVKRYEGYSPPSDDTAVFGVELRLRDDRGYETHIVKLGLDSQVGRDADNWKACTDGREMASRIFAPVSKVTMPDGQRAAVLYRDAYTLFGPGHDEEFTPRSLEKVADMAVFSDSVDPKSVERAVAHIFTDLHSWFYRGARRDAAAAARAFYRNELVSQKDRRDALALWSTNPDRLDLRRDALWLFCGRDRPDVNHAARPARYLDPVELVGWALDAAEVPETLVGRGHGDLHGRNILLGIRRFAAEYPAVFDYGGMGCANVLAWDFAKLETELKVRLLQNLYRNDAAHAALRKHPGWTWKQASELHDETTHRAERLRFFFVFEEMLAERTGWIKGREIARAWQPPGKPVGVAELDRLLALILRVRQEAALALGFEVGRVDSWRDELFFALAVYGLVNARWSTYSEPQAQSALVSAGVAAAHASFARNAVAQLATAAEPPPGPHPSYRVPLAHAHRLWKAGRRDEGKELLDGLIHHHGHAVPLIAEHALFRCDAGECGSVAKQLDQLRDKARAFDDEETLTRLGRAFKEMADESWERDGLRFDQLGGHPSVQFYRLALQAYEDAYRLGGYYFPGVNVAALALLVGDAERARAIAAQLLADCATMTMPHEEVYWIFAAEGDAALILDQGAVALRFYGNAINALQEGEDGYAVSSYRQLLRLRGPLGAALVNPILSLYEGHPRLGPIIQQQVTRRIPG